MDYKEKATILQVCSSKKGERCSHCPAFGQGCRNCMKNAMKDGAAAITELLVENQALRNAANGFKTRAEEAEAENAALRRMQPVQLDDECARALELAADVSELRQKLVEAEAACAYHKYRRCEANATMRELVMTAYGIRKKLEAAEDDNKKLCAAMMQLKRTDRPERKSVVYVLEYDSSMSHKTMEEVARIFFRGLMDADLKLRGQKEE